MTGPFTEKVTVTLDKNAVGHIAYQAASEVSDIFSLAFGAITNADPDQIPPVADEQMNFNLRMEGRTAVEQREAYVRRLVAMCFSDLARAIRETLETAYAHMGVLLTSSTDFAADGADEVLAKVVARMDTLRVEAQALTYPPLLERVQSGLSAPLTWAPELTSFQKVRNCLEHRGGVVGQRDVDQSGRLTFSLPTIELYQIDPDGNEAPLQFDVPTKTEIKLMARSIIRTQTFNLGERVTIPPRQVKEVAFAVSMLAADLVAKMPSTDHIKV